MAEDKHNSISSNQNPSEEESLLQAKESLSDCLFSQYAATFAGVSGGTAYSLYKKPKNGIGIMVLAGTLGSLLDVGVGYMVTCRPQVDVYQQQKLKVRARKVADLEKQGITLESVRKAGGGW